MDKITTNYFLGRDTDTSHSLIQPDKYIEAHNIEIVGDGKFQALKNIAGTTNVQQIVASSTVVPIGVFDTKFLISGTTYNCLLIFTYTPSATFNIYCYNTETDTLYALYQETITAGYTANDRVVDAKLHPENGTDFVYFSDFYFEPRFLKCEIPSPYTANFLSANDISLQRRGANGTIVLSSISGSVASPLGTLLSGTYQYSYRMCDPDNKRFTKWSTPTSPIHVYTIANSGSPVYSGIGLSTPRKITLTITPSTAETDEYDYLQLAVIENVGPTVSDINGVTAALPTTASLLEITSIPGTSLTFDHKSNSRIGTIPITDITVDLAQIDKVKTLAVKENRLVMANVHYKDLDFDNGTPAITGGSILIKDDSSADAFSGDEFASKYVGHFRGEVYRYGVVYSDKYGNKSTVKHLDLSGVTDNIITGGVKDLKFPERHTNPTYAVINSTGRTQSLGLRISGLTGHPTWATSVEIVRVKRKKNVLFQSPLIPMTTVYGVGAVSNYPTIHYNGTADVTIDSAQPQTSGYIICPKNLFWPELRQIVPNGSSSGSGTTSYKTPNEVSIARTSTYTFGQVFPSPSMFGDSPFVYTGTEKMDFVDYALLKLSYSDYSTVPASVSSNAGDFFRTNIVGNFYAVEDGQYFFDYTTSRSALTKNIPITGYEFFDNLGQPASLAGVSVMDYEALQTKGVEFWNTPPTIQRCGVIKIGSAQTDLMSQTIAFKSGTLNAVGDNNFMIGSSGVRYEDSSTHTNSYITSYGSFVPNSSYVSAIPIVNIKLGLGDDRYGDVNAFHEYISTGAKYTFTAAEVATLQSGGSVTTPAIDVWGGDCFVGPQVFKVADSSYSVVNQSKNYSLPASTADNVARWGSVYLYDTGTNSPVICMPVAVESAGQYVQVIIESEYSEVRDTDTIESNAGGALNAYPIWINKTKDSIRTPLSYRYNLNLSKQNDRKVYVPEPLYSFKQSEFGARLVYSDEKIYNSDQQGFDVFRVGNIYDLEESRRDITKLAVAGDNLYAIQDQGVVYIPTGSRQIEQASGGQLSVRSGEFIGRPLVIDSTRGGQHLRGIVETGQVVYIPDNVNKSVYALSGRELKPIIALNETQFRTFFSSTLPENVICGVYDPVRREYWLVDHSNNRCEVFNEQNGWVGNYDFTKLMGGVSCNQKLYLLGRPSSSLDIYSMYDGTVNQLFGLSVTPSVSFVVNPDGDIGKVFDNIMITSSAALSTIDFETQRAEGNQTVTGTSVNVTPKGGSYRLATPRATGDERLKGLRMKVTLKWQAVVSTLNAFYTKYRLRNRFPF